ncbi:ABC transporter ATP-binding protein [Microbacterium sp. NPDC096154]|uniref:ABC transporter ATP-binding protein n=1 Tax=Microbacterium sp. NPDC096154 TaxID=3155549 RepID=UPI003320C683
MTTPAIEVQDLRKSYGRTPALRGIDLRLEPGAVLGLIGPNGAGKTTTLRILLDILRPSAGVVRVLGEDPRRGGPALRRRIGYLPGDLRLDERVTGRALLSFYGRVSSPGGHRRAQRLADRLEIDLSRPVGTLSKGNRQKLGIIQAFMHEPELLVLDEPTSGLDPLVQRTFLDLVREARQDGRAVLLSSHVLSEIQQVADDVAVLADGRIIATGDVESLRRGAARRVRAVFGGTDSDGVWDQIWQLPLRETSLSDEPDGVHLEALYDGDLDAFIKTISWLETRELDIQEPDLEDAVLQLYSRPEVADPETGPLDLGALFGEKEEGA